MTATQKARYCRCGVRLARDNADTRCSACVAVDRGRVHAAPNVPADFWDEVVLRESLLARHMGRAIRAWRTHPHHGRCPVPQDRVAAWVGITQAQLSRIETGPPLAHLDRLIQWARVLHIPAGRLWFALPDEADPTNDEEDSVKRRTILATGLTMVGSLAIPTPVGQELTAERAAEWLAWQLWQQRADHLHRDQIPSSVGRVLANHPHVLIDADGLHRFTDPALVDVLVARRVFGDITSGTGHLLATAQTSHTTDLAISAMAAADDTAKRALTGWMRQGTTAVLRVNAAGVLAKVGTADLGDAAITALADDPDTRHLYLTAVASRVLGTPWGQAGQLAAGLSTPRPAGSQLADQHSAWVERLAVELSNRRDAAARWCATVLLAHLQTQSPDITRAALGRAIRDEPCRENLRAYAAVLAGASPLTT